MPQARYVSIRANVVPVRGERGPATLVVLRHVEVKINHIIYFQGLRLPVAPALHRLHLEKQNR
jgi:hypothetical protein